MQGRGGGRGSFFDMGGPFAGFGGFGSFGSPGGLIPSLFGGRDPFDDPFFTQPFGGMFGSSPFGGPTGFPFPRGMHPSGFPELQPPAMHPSGFPELQAPAMHPSGFLERQAPAMHPSGFLERQAPAMHPSGFLERQAPEPNRRRGPIIQELDSDDENEDATEEKKVNPRKHGRSDEEPDEEHPDDEIEGKKSKHFQAGNEYDRFNTTGSLSQSHSQNYATVPQPQFHSNATVHQPQSHSFCFQSSTVSYGGPNGTYYTSSRTRRSGSDGVTFEESKEADSSTRQASHRVSRGIHDKGHSLSRKLNSDGKVDTMQTLHNINEDELAGFEEEWKGKGQMYFPGWTGSIEGSGNNGQAEQARQGGWALPSTEHNHNVGTVSAARDTVGSSHTQERRARTDSSGRSAHRAGRRG